MRSFQLFLLFASIHGFLGVALGAFGAHGLEGKLSDRMMEIWDKAVFYQLVHALALAVVALLMMRGEVAGAKLAGWGFFIGILLFSGSLYVLALSGIKVLGAVTPFGGLAFLLGWAALAYAAMRLN